MRKIVDFFSVLVSAFSPLIGVIWLGWNITEVIFYTSSKPAAIEV